MDYIINLYKNNKLTETRKTTVVINNRFITLTCSDIDKIQLYDDIQRYIATYYYCFKQDGKITFKKKPYNACEECGKQLNNEEIKEGVGFL